MEINWTTRQSQAAGDQDVNLAVFEGPGHLNAQEAAEGV